LILGYKQNTFPWAWVDRERMGVQGVMPIVGDRKGICPHNIFAPSFTPDSRDNCLIPIYLKMAIKLLER